MLTSVGKIAARLLAGLNKIILASRTVGDKQTEIIVDKKHLPFVCQHLFEEKKGRLFTMTGTDERLLNGCFGLYYVFCFDDTGQLITIKVLLDEAEPSFPSVAALLPAANWYEREVKDLLGLRALDHPDRRPLVLHGDWPEDYFPLRKDFPAGLQIARYSSRESHVEYDSEHVTQIPVGPIHAGIIEPGHFRFGAVGDTVLHLEARLFYTHRGLEKSSEGLPLGQALFTAERICGVCALSHAVAYAQAVEAAAQTVIPPRAAFLRTLFLELERLYNHIGDIGNMCAGFGLAVGVSHGGRLRERLLALNEALAGHRYLRGVVALGGLKVDVSAEQLRQVRKLLDVLSAEFDDLLDIILTHEVALDRMAGTGILTARQAVDLGVVGVAARASGCRIDSRLALPYAAYDQLQFAVPVYQEGDVLARFKVRADEVKASFGIIRQVLSILPVGDVRVQLGSIAAYTQALGWVESPRGELCHWLMTGEDETVYRYRVRSAAYSNWPAVPLTVPGNIVPDFPLINKSFELCYSCCDR